MEMRTIAIGDTVVYSEIEFEVLGFDVDYGGRRLVTIGRPAPPPNEITRYMAGLIGEEPPAEGEVIPFNVYLRDLGYQDHMVADEEV